MSPAMINEGKYLAMAFPRKCSWGKKGVPARSSPKQNYPGLDSGSPPIPVSATSCMYVCTYVWSHIWQEYGSTGQGCQSCLWSAEQAKRIFPCPRSCLRPWSCEMGSAVPSRVSLLISILRLNLVLTYGIPRGGVHLFTTSCLLR